MRSKVLRESVALMSKVIARIGFNKGSLTYWKIWKKLAPSTYAASIGSRGIDSKPAVHIRMINGVHCHMSVKTTARRDVEVRPNHALLGKLKRLKK
jgi:hypothetical protein